MLPTPSTLHVSPLDSRKMPHPFRLAIGTLAALLLAAVILIETAHFLGLAVLFVTPLPVAGDALEYFAMGRAWLNGLHIYRDLFDAKPPGVFLLAAFAMRLGGTGLGYPLYASSQIILLASIGPMLAIFTYRALDRSLGTVRWCAISVNLLLGISIAVATLDRTRGFQTEGFALLFATLPAILFASPFSARRSIVDVVAGVSLAIACLFKEPFLGSALLATFVFCQSRADLYRALRMLMIAGVAFLSMLVLSGTFAPYVSIYLPEMLAGRAVGALKYPDFGTRVQYVIAAPIWVRSLNVYKFFTELASPRSAAFLPIFFILCLCLWAPLKKNALRLIDVSAAAAIVVASLVVGHHFFLLHQLVSGVHGQGHRVPWDHPIIVRLIAICLAVPTLLLIAFALVPRRLRSPKTLYLFAGLAVVGTFTQGAVLTSGSDYGIHYLVYALPPFLTLSVYCVNALAIKRHHHLLVPLGAVLVLNAAMPGRFDYKRLADYYSGAVQTSSWYAARAVDVDSLLTGCNESRYFIAANNEPRYLHGFTRTSPYQLVYEARRALGAHQYGSLSYAPNPYLAAKLTQDLRSARIAIAGAKDDPDEPQALDPLLYSGTAATRPAVVNLDTPPGTPDSQIPSPIATVMRSKFTTEPPPCANGKVPIPGLQVFFRRE